MSPQPTRSTAREDEGPDLPRSGSWIPLTGNVLIVVLFLLAIVILRLVR